MPIKINIYIIKKFLSNFALIASAIMILVAMINIFELLDRVAGKQISFGQIILLDILQVPSFIEEIAPFLVMLSSMTTLFSLSIRSEINVMMASGLSLWQVLLPIAFGAFLLGLFFVLIFNPISIISSKKLSKMQQVLIEKEEENLLQPPHGVWLKQDNLLNNGGNIVIKATKVYRKNLQMKNITFWFFNKKNQFYKKIDAKDMFLKEGFWFLNDVTTNYDNNVNQLQDHLKIATNLKADFITKKILNNFENVNLFSVYELPNLINNLKDSGFSPRKFLVYYNLFLVKPFLFIAMALMAAFFAINSVRSKYNIIFFVFGIAAGLVLYISLVIIAALGSSGVIPIFLSTWVVVVVLMTISMLLIFKKESIT